MKRMVKKMSSLHILLQYWEILFVSFTFIVPEGVAEVDVNVLGFCPAGARKVGGATVAPSSSKGKDGKHLQGRRKNLAGDTERKFIA